MPDLQPARGIFRIQEFSRLITPALKGAEKLTFRLNERRPRPPARPDGLALISIRRHIILHSQGRDIPKIHGEFPAKEREFRLRRGF